MKRRTFLEILGLAGTAPLAGPRRAEAAVVVAPPDSRAILIDLGACMGCRSCEAACAEANGLPEPAVDPTTVDEIQRTTSDRQWVVVNRHRTSKGDVFARRQCMHCVQPACAAACLTKALYKTPEGPVVWREQKCMGCRFCMISCPFDAPKFEYGSPVPRIQKCRMCFERLRRGEKPACVESCPAGALTFGTRSELLEIARKKVYGSPGQYVSHIYGEREAGGTNVLYISPVPFEELGFPTHLGETPYPEYSRTFLTAVPVVLTLWPAFLLALRRATEPGPGSTPERGTAPEREV